MALTKITAGVLKDSTLVVGDLAATGTASSATTLFGNDTWGSAASSGLLNIAASDPGAGQTTGNTWYLSGAVNFVTLKSQIPGTWVAGGAMTYAVQYMANGTGTQGAGLISFGWGPSVLFTLQSAEYSGAAWTTGNNGLTTAANSGGFGTQSAGVVYAGLGSGPTYRNQTQEYDGTSWTSGGNYPNNTQATKGAGISSAGLGTGGTSIPATSPASTPANTYDGTSWSASVAMNWGTDSHACTGSQSNAMVMGGNGDLNGSQSFDGSSWTTESNMTRDQGGEAGSAGTGNNAMVFGGSPQSDTTTIEFDGTSWSGNGRIITGRYGAFGCGTSGAALMTGGWSNLTSTEMFTKWEEGIEFVGV